MDISTKMSIKEALHGAKKLHFVGIGGVSISALALLSLERGYTVSGSDRSPGVFSKKCEEKGIKVIYGHFAESADDCDAIIYTAAVPLSSPELARGRERGIPLITRADFLGYIMEDYDKRFGISGTHGKTTTTSMLSHIFISAGLNPTVANGAVTEELGGSLGIGGNEYFVYEACEYKDSFLSFSPTTAVITNIELDHTDYYPSLDSVIRSFAKSLEGASVAVINADDENALLASRDFRGRLIKISLLDESADYYAKDLHYERGRGVYTLCKNGVALSQISLSVIGAFNVYNSLCAAACASESGVKPCDIASALSSFKPAKRRFEIKREKDGIIIADDYAHHPSEIAATLKGVKGIGAERIICIFQPHTYTRTRDLFDSFVWALSAADIVILAKIFPARETDTLGVSSEMLAEKLDSALYFDSFEEIASYVSKIMRRGDIVLTMGAGDVYKVGEMLLDIT